MISIIDRKTTKSMISLHGERRKITGRTAEFREIFSRMKSGESFVYPVSGDIEKRKMASSIKGTCQHLRVRIKTRTVKDGILVIFEGYK